MKSRTGYDGVPYEIAGEGTIEEGKLLFQQTLSVDLPYEATTYNFELGKSGTASVVAGSEP